MRNIYFFRNLLISVLVIFFGERWYIFIGYLVLNLIDCITGSLKAIKLKEISSYIGIIELSKKIGYWVILCISFYISYIFVIIGNNILGISLTFMYLLGWYTLASLMINEVISILENLTLLSIKVPYILFKSLKVAKKILENSEKKIFNEKR